MEKFGDPGLSLSCPATGFSAGIPNPEVDIFAPHDSKKKKLARLVPPYSGV
jgi:hypothetical protein